MILCLVEICPDVKSSERELWRMHSGFASLVKLMQAAADMLRSLRGSSLSSAGMDGRICKSEKHGDTA